MKFTLRQFAGFFLICGMLLVIVLQRINTNKLDQKLQGVYGPGYETMENNRYMLKSLGGETSPEYEEGSLILQINSTQKQLLEVTHYDGNTQQSAVKLLPLDDSMIAISLIKTPKYKSFSFDSLYFWNAKTNQAFTFNIPGLQSWHGPGSAVQELDGKIMLTYFFPKESIAGTMEHSEAYSDEVKIKAICDKYKEHAIYFRILPR